MKSVSKMSQVLSDLDDETTVSPYGDHFRRRVTNSLRISQGRDNEFLLNPNAVYRLDFCKHRERLHITTYALDPTGEPVAVQSYDERGYWLVHRETQDFNRIPGLSNEATWICLDHRLVLPRLSEYPVRINHQKPLSRRLFNLDIL